MAEQASPRASRTLIGRRGAPALPLALLKRGFRGSVRGTVSVEYVVLLSVVTLALALATGALGPTLRDGFEWQVAVLGLPFP